MPRLTIFAKGNCDVADSLFASHDTSGRWDGLNEALRDVQSPWRVRLQHETLLRSDALLAAPGSTPPALEAFTFAPPYGALSQFSTALFDGDADAYVLSIVSDVTMTLARHRSTGHLFFPGWPGEIPQALRAWLRAECEPAPLLTADQSRANLSAIVARLRSRTQAPILIYNLSSATLGDQIAMYRGAEETLRTRILRFNLALVDLSAETGVFIVDVDRLIALAGAEQLKLDNVRFNAAGSRLVAAEVLRLLSEAGCLV
jgi:hypothetical protein